MGEMVMKKVLLIGLIGCIGCMQLEYIEVSNTSSSGEAENSSSSFEIPKLEMGKHELAHTGISYYEAILLCNKMSLEEGLDTLYQYDKPIFTDNSLFWLPNITLLENRSGYRLPTKEEWERANANGEIEKLNEDVGEWLYSESNSQFAVFELAPHFIKVVGLYRERGEAGYPVYGVRMVRIIYIYI
jgi:hypothetical protein